MATDFVAFWTAFGDRGHLRIVLTAEPLAGERQWFQMMFDQYHSTEHVHIWIDESGHPVRVEASGLDSLGELDSAIAEIHTTELGISGSPNLHIGAELADPDQTWNFDSWYWPHGQLAVKFRTEAVVSSERSTDDGHQPPRRSTGAGDSDRRRSTRLR